MSSASRKNEWETFRPELDTLYLKLDLETKEIIILMGSIYTFQASKEEYERRFQNWGFRKKLTREEWMGLYYYCEARRENSGFSSFYHNGRFVSRFKVAKGLSRYRPSSFQRIQQKVVGGPVPPIPDGFCESRLESANRDLGLDALPWIQFVDRFLEHIKGSICYRWARENTFGPHSISQDINRSVTSSCSIEIINGLFSGLEFVPRRIFRAQCLAKQHQTRSTKSKMPEANAVASSFLTRAKPIFLGRTDEDLLKKLRRLFCATGEDFCQTLMFFSIFLSANNFLSDEKLQDVIRWLRPHVELAGWGNLLSNGSDYMKKFLFQALRAAIGIGFVDLVKALLGAGLSPNHPTSKSSEYTCLQAAVKNRNPEILRVLLSFGANINHSGSQQTTILELAGRTGEPELVRILLEAGASVNGPQNRNHAQSALLEALIDGNLEIALDLVEYGADVHAVDPNISSATYGWSCLTAAVFTKDVGIVQLILDRGVAVNYQHVRYWKGAEVRGITALHAACKVGCSELVSLLLNRGADLHLPAVDLGTPIRVAAFTPGDRSDMIQMLLNASSVFQFINNHPLPTRHDGAQSHSQDTRSSDFERLCISTLTDCDLALRDAAIRGNIKTFRLLLRNGGNRAVLDMPRVEDSMMRSIALDINGFFVANKSDIDCLPKIALQAAVQARNKTMVRELLSAGAGVNVRDLRGNTALNAALHIKDHSLIKILLDAGADVNPKGFQSPLTLAAIKGDLISVRMLLNRGSSVNLPVEAIPVMVGASCGGNIEVVRLLLENGAPIDTPQCQSPTALECAVRKDNIELIRVLLAAGAQVNVPWPRAEPSTLGFPAPVPTALQRAVVLGDMQIIQILLERNADVNAMATGPGRMDALQLAILKDDPQIISALLHAGARVNLSSDQDCEHTALQLAAQFNNVGVVKELLRWGADINAVGCGRWQQTALQSAVENRNIDTVRELLLAGAAVNAPPGWSHRLSCIDKCCIGRGKHPKSALQVAVGGGGTAHHSH